MMIPSEVGLSGNFVGPRYQVRRTQVPNLIGPRYLTWEDPGTWKSRSETRPSPLMSHESTRSCASERERSRLNWPNTLRIRSASDQITSDQITSHQITSHLI
eukprot:2349643-Rhodomonas_salina.1